MLKVKNKRNEKYLDSFDNEYEKCEKCGSNNLIHTKEGDVVCTNCGIVKEERIIFIRH